MQQSQLGIIRKVTVGSDGAAPALLLTVQVLSGYVDLQLDLTSARAQEILTSVKDIQHLVSRACRVSQDELGTLHFEEMVIA